MQKGQKLYKKQGIRTWHLQSPVREAYHYTT
jgi:hypothetical protein